MATDREVAKAADELEITPKMLEAGILAFGEFYIMSADMVVVRDPGYASKAIFAAMMKAKQKEQAVVAPERFLYVWPIAPKQFP